MNNVDYLNDLILQETPIQQMSRLEFAKAMIGGVVVSGAGNPDFAELFRDAVALQRSRHG